MKFDLADEVSDEELADLDPSSESEFEVDDDSTHDEFSDLEEYEDEDFTDLGSEAIAAILVRLKTTRLMREKFGLQQRGASRSRVLDVTNSPVRAERNFVKHLKRGNAANPQLASSRCPSNNKHGILCPCADTSPAAMLTLSDEENLVVVSSSQVSI